MDFPNFEVSDRELLEAVENEEKERFPNLTTQELDSLVEKSQAPSTKTNTKWAVKLFEGKLRK